MDLQLTLMQNWYAAQCNGDWEHCYGIEITTLDNPGWRLRIALEETSLQNASFSEVRLERNEQDWLQCWVSPSEIFGRKSATVFQAACGTNNLVEVLQIFNDWADIGGV